MYQEILHYIQSQLATNQFFSAAALAGVMGSAVVMLKSVPLKIWLRIRRHIHYSATVEDTTNLLGFLDLWMSDEYIDKLRQVEAAINHNNDKLSLSHNNDYIYVWYNRRRIRIEKSKQRLENASSTDSAWQRSYHISGFFAKRAIQKMLNSAIQAGKDYEDKLKLERDSIDVFTSNGHYFSKAKKTKHKKFNQIYLANKEEIIADLNKFKSHRELMNDLGVLYKRGYLLYGKPGNGKSSLAYAIADYMKYDLYLLDLADMSSSGFAIAIRNVPNNSVIVIEDIDAFFKKRKPVGKNEINFSTFINALSGVAQKDGVITVITTNKIEDLDEALLRDGRCDMRVYIDDPNQQLAEEYLSKVYKQEVLLPNYKGNLSFARLQGIVLKNIDSLENCLHEIQNARPDIAKRARVRNSKKPTPRKGVRLSTELSPGSGLHRVPASPRVDDNGRSERLIILEQTLSE